MIKLMRVLLIVLFWLSFDPITWGNTGVFYGSGNQVMPIKNNKIRLVKENVSIKLTIEENNGRFGVPFIPWANVTAIFYLKNTTKDKVTLQMGFPFLDLQGFGDEQYVLDNLNFKVLDNDNEVATEFKDGIIEDKLDPDGLFKKVFVWSAVFEPSQERRVIVTYKMLMGVASANSVFRDFDEEGSKFRSMDKLFPAIAYNFSYITRTAYTWAGTIDEGVFELDCSDFHKKLSKQDFLAMSNSDNPGYTRPVFLENVNPPAREKREGVYRWVFKEKVPEDGLSLSTVVMFFPGNPSELKNYYNKTVSELKDLNVEEFNAVLKAYYQIIAFAKEPPTPFLRKYFKDLGFLRTPKTFIFESDKIGVEEISNNFDDILNK